MWPALTAIQALLKLDTNNYLPEFCIAITSCFSYSLNIRHTKTPTNSNLHNSALRRWPVQAPPSPNLCWVLETLLEKLLRFSLPRTIIRTLITINTTTSATLAEQIPSPLQVTTEPMGPSDPQFSAPSNRDTSLLIPLSPFPAITSSAEVGLIERA